MAKALTLPSTLSPNGNLRICSWAFPFFHTLPAAPRGQFQTVHMLSISLRCSSLHLYHFASVHLFTDCTLDYCHPSLSQFPASTYAVTKGLLKKLYEMIDLYFIVLLINLTWHS